MAREKKVFTIMSIMTYNLLTFYGEVMLPFLLRFLNLHSLSGTIAVNSQRMAGCQCRKTFHHIHLSLNCPPFANHCTADCPVC
jgi:hypothetical protein